MSKREIFEEVSPDISKPSREALIWQLRHPAMWDHAIAWNYGDCEKCAMEVFQFYWGGDRCIAPELKLSSRDFLRIFYELRNHYPDDAVTPSIVADELERAKVE